MIRQKNEYWQIIRGICILVVVAIHCPNALNYDNSNVQFHLYMFIRALINFPVAIFLFLSGYFVNKEKCLDNPGSYILNRGGLRLLIPYLIWSAIYIAISAISHETMSLSTILFRLLTGKAAGPLYYIIVLLQLTIITPALVKYKPKRVDLLWLVTPIALIFIYWSAVRLNSIPWMLDTFFPIWFYFYYIGLLLSNDNLKMKDFMLQIGKWPYVVLAFGLNILESYLLMGLNITPNLSVSQNRLGGFLYALTLIAFIYKHSLVEAKCEKSILSWMGDKSYAIYFLHYLVLKVITRIIGNRFSDFWLLRFVLSFVGTLILTCVAIQLFTLLINKLKMNKLLKYIGF